MGDKSASGSSRRWSWEQLPEEAFAVWAPQLPVLANEIIAAIAEEVPAYSRPLEGTFGEAVQHGVVEALRRFSERRGARDGDSQGDSVYLILGRTEARDGRPLEALLAAYRVGARVAWRRLAASGLEAGIDPEILALLAEGLFAYIDELSAESAEGYAREQALNAGEIDRRREACLELLLRDPPVSWRTLEAAAEIAGWTVPARLAIVVWPQARGRRPVARLPLGCLAGTVDGLGCAAVPDPEAPGRRGELDAAVGGAAGLGPAVAPGDAARSLRRAAGALGLADQRGHDGLLASDDHLSDLLLRGDPALVDEIAARRLAPLDGETERSRERLEETLLAWLRHEGNATAAGDELGVHGQTVRYRLGRLRGLFGATLDDPDARFEVELALRARAE